MVVNKLVLKNRDVVYLKERYQFGEICFKNKKFKLEQKTDVNSLLRVENINGKLDVSLLPTIYTSENNIYELILPEFTTALVTNEEQTNHVVLKKGKYGDELGLQTLTLANMNKEEYLQKVNSLAQDDKYKKNFMTQLVELYNHACDKLNTGNGSKIKDVYALFVDIEEYPLVSNFLLLTEDREQALNENLAPENV